MEIRTTTKGRIVIPALIRRKFDIKKGTRISIEVDEKERNIILKPITRKYIKSLRGKFQGRGLLETFMAEKKRERTI